MLTLCRAYTTTRDAEDAIERLLASGVPAMRIVLIMGHAFEDARDAPIGTFAGTATADAMTVGSFANIPHNGRHAMGSFAGNPDRQRRGSFGDSDRDTVTTYQSGVKRTRIASHRRLKKLLVDAGLPPALAVANVDALHAGRVLVMAQSDSAPDDITAVLDDLEQKHAQQTSRAAA